jgi:hypothetical protein
VGWGIDVGREKMLTMRERKKKEGKKEMFILLKVSS